MKVLSSHAGGGWDGHAQMILYWVTRERHISHAIAAAQRLDVSPRKPQLQKITGVVIMSLFCVLSSARRHADAILSCEGPSQGRPHRKAGSLPYRPGILRG